MTKAVFQKITIQFLQICLLTFSFSQKSLRQLPWRPSPNLRQSLSLLHNRNRHSPAPQITINNFIQISSLLQILLNMKMSESLFYLWPWSNSRKSMKYGIVEIWGLKDNIGAFVVIPLLCCLQEITVLLRIEKLQRLTRKKILISSLEVMPIYTPL